MTTNPGAADGLAAARGGLFGRAMTKLASLDPAATVELSRRQAQDFRERMSL